MPASPASAAAPTAGLHFTPELLSRIREAGVETAFVTLHVGLDTFRPVQGEDPTEHHIHTERYSLDADTADALNRARAGGRRVIAVGTTSVRVLEQAATDAAREGRTSFEPVESDAGIYILPGHRFRAVDAMLTNFHLPPLHAADAGVRLRPARRRRDGRLRAADDVGRLRRSRPPTLPFLQLRRRDADCVAGRQCV